MRKIIRLSALLLAIAFALAACAGEPRQVNRTYGWLFIDGEKLAEGYVTWWRCDNDRIILEIDGRRYTTAAENVVIVEMPEPIQKETEARPC